MHCRRVGLEVTELLLLLGIQPPLTTSLFWRLVKAAVLVEHEPSVSQNWWCNEPSAMKRLLMLLSALLVSSSPAIAWEPGDDWRDEQCETVIDGANRVANVCRGIYGRGEIFLGVYWRDGAEVVGPCDPSESWPIEYQGLSRADSFTWLVEYCNW